MDAIDEHHSRCTLSQGDRFPAVAIPCLAAPPSPLVDALSKLIERDRILDRPIDRIAKAADEAERTVLEAQATGAVARLSLLEPARFTFDANEQALL